MEVVITKSKNSSKKKYDARIDGTKTASFGEQGASDFTIHKNTDRKEAYIARHKAREDWNKSNIASPAWMSRYIMGKPTLKGAVDNANKNIQMLNLF